MRQRIRMVAIVCVAAGLAAAGCAGRGEATDAQSTTEEREEALLAFTECMREHGIDMPDPESGGRPGLRIVRGERTDASREEMEEAHEACEEHLEGAVQELTPEEESEMRDRMLAFAECMRENGVDMPDPDFSDSGGGAFRQRIGSAIDPDDPDFEAAQEKCSDEVFAGQDGPRGGAGPRVFFGGSSGRSG